MTFLSGVWSVGSQARLRFRPAGSISQATHVLVVPHAFVGTRDIVPLEQKADAVRVRAQRAVGQVVCTAHVTHACGRWMAIHPLCALHLADLGLGV